MPAILEDPAASHNPSPASRYLDHIKPRHITLRDGAAATVLPFFSRSSVPVSLQNYLAAVFAKEIDDGDTYPLDSPLSEEQFGAYWFQNFAGIMLLGEFESGEEVWELDAAEEGTTDWKTLCLGTFYTKPNYPGRSSHICNAGFLVGPAARNRGVGRLLGEAYVYWAPRLGYRYSVFNLVYETNVASLRIWDGLGFQRIGRVPGAGRLKSYPDRFVDAVVFGRELKVEEGEVGERGL
jgi:GNAT superfamily N-acetyltransferase